MRKKNNKYITEKRKQIKALKRFAQKYKSSYKLSDKAQYGALMCRIEDVKDEIKQLNQGGYNE